MDLSVSGVHQPTAGSFGPAQAAADEARRLPVYDPGRRPAPAAPDAAPLPRPTGADAQGALVAPDEADDGAPRVGRFLNVWA